MGIGIKLKRFLHSRNVVTGSTLTTVLIITVESICSVGFRECAFSMILKLATIVLIKWLIYVDVYIKVFYMYKCLIYTSMYVFCMYINHFINVVVANYQMGVRHVIRTYYY